MKLPTDVNGRRPYLRPSRNAFTLIELLTVVAIISLLIAIVVPGLSKARDQAKGTKIRSLMKSMGDGLELFRNENPDEVRGDGYPSSAIADDPTESGEQVLFGAQWIVRYLLGKDLQGYVPKKIGNPAIADPNSVQQFWEQRDWYEDEPTAVIPNAPLSRTGPYIEASQLRLDRPENIPGAQEAMLGLIGVPVDTKSMKQHVVLDEFNYPVLYYSANAALAQRPNAPVAGWGSYANPTGFPRGVYTHADNGLFTGHCLGSEGSPGTCDMQGWHYDSDQDHQMKYFGAYPNDKPDPNSLKLPENRDTFAYYILNRNVFESTEYKTAVPSRKDSFIFISAGKDGVYGTVDDITNF